MKKYENNSPESFKVQYFQNKTAASVASIGVGSSHPSRFGLITPVPITLMEFSLIPLSLNDEGLSSQNGSQIDSHAEFLKMANSAYAALNKNDRDEMDIWDSTIDDGLAE